MYELVVVNKFGKLSILTSNNLEELKKVAKKLNKKQCDVEIVEKSVVFRIVSMK